MEYLPTSGETWPHSRRNVDKYSRPMEHLGHTVDGQNPAPPG